MSKGNENISLLKDFIKYKSDKQDIIIKWIDTLSNWEISLLSELAIKDNSRFKKVLNAALVILSVESGVKVGNQVIDGVDSIDRLERTILFIKKNKDDKVSAYVKYCSNEYIEYIFKNNDMFNKDDCTEQLKSNLLSFHAWLEYKNSLEKRWIYKLFCNLTFKTYFYPLVRFLCYASDKRKDYWLKNAIDKGKDYKIQDDKNIWIDYNHDFIKTSYTIEDVELLLNGNIDMVEMDTKQREEAIQKGVHYSSMLPKEHEPSQEYLDLYYKALRTKKTDIALGIAKIAEMIKKKCDTNLKNSTPVLISLVRAGLPVGILIKRYLKDKYNMEVYHYGISIIRDIGIDEKAMEHIYNYHNDIGVENFIFIDGWTGKGAIKQQLVEAVQHLKTKEYKDNRIDWSKLSDDLYVLADPAYITEYCGTHEDYLLPSACLNSTVSGLISRSLYSDDLGTELGAQLHSGAYHGAVPFWKFRFQDHSNEFIDTIWEEFNQLDYVDSTINSLGEKEGIGLKAVLDICNQYNIKDYKKVKPGIGETTRVLLRRVPWKVLINTSTSMDDADIQHIITLCKEKNIPIERFSTGNYKVVGIIKELSADA